MSDKPPELGIRRILVGGALLAAMIVFRPEPSPTQEAQKLCQKAFLEADAAVRKKHGHFMSREGQKETQAVLENHQACMRKAYEQRKLAIKEEPKP